MFYRIIANLGTEKVDVEHINALIQISECQLDGFKPVIEDEKPEEKDGYYIAYDYKIINGEVHKVYRLEETINEEEE